MDSIKSSEMECTQQYALHDGDAGGPQRWIAHVRLTPELLQRLQQNPSSVTIRLQAPGGGGAARPSTRKATNKLSSVITVSDGDDQSTYEMLSFVEDPKVNAVCAFRADPFEDEEHKGDSESGDAGYSLYHVGNVFQKLIVQRMLDSTEKDRMKDRHAKSVLESKARSAKFVAADETTGPSKRPSRARELMPRGVVMSHPPGHDPSRLAKRGDGKATEASMQTYRRKFKSALTEATAQELHDRITQGHPSEAIEETEDTARPPATSMLFSSDSEPETSPKVLEPLTESSLHADSKQSANKHVPAYALKAARKALETKKQEAEATNQASDMQADSKQPTRPAYALKAARKSLAKEIKPTAVDVSKVNVPEPESAAQPMSPSEAINSADDTSTDCAAPASVTEPSTAFAAPISAGTKRKAADQSDVETTSRPVLSKISLPPVKAAKGETKKRARPRLSRLPDLSFFPQHVQDICKRVAAHITRTAILDDADFESFATEHDRFRAEWEALDKAYSIESILIDGAHFQLPFATTDDEKLALRTTIQEAEKKREGLLFVRDSMATIHKILASLQASISAYERKNEGRT